MYRVLMYALVEVSAELSEQLVAIETGGEDAVHQARTRVRRLRSILAVYRAAFDREAAKRMRDRLSSLGRRLGEVRDREVRARDLATLVGSDTPAAVREAVEAITAGAREQHDRALDDLLRRLRSRGHRELLADLQQFAAAPPLSRQGAEHPRRIADKGLAKAVKRLRRESEDTLEGRHLTRKAARRLRYAAEAVSDLFEPEAAELAAAAEELHDTLGDHRDLVLLARHLRAQAEEPQLTGEVREGLQRLAAECERRATERIAGLDDALAAVDW